MKTIKSDAVIVGGGVMGLMSAYELCKQGLSVVIVDKKTIGGLQSASVGLTRSIRNDYKDPVTAQMANDAYKSWLKLQNEWGIKIIDSCGCLNIFNKELLKISQNKSYATDSLTWLKRDRRSLKTFPSFISLKSQYPQINADFAVLDIDAGVALPRVVTSKLLNILRADKQVNIFEKQDIVSIEQKVNSVTVSAKERKIIASKLIVVAGLGTVEVCKKIKDQSFILPIRGERPFELKYFFPERPAGYVSNIFPIFAFLDVGIYGHPIIEGVTAGVKIGYYSPPGVGSSQLKSAQFIDRFVQTCLPDLYQQSQNRIITEVDQCSYDMTLDNQFILGYLGGNKNIIIAAGFNGTGYKFAPTITKIVKELILERKPIYDITRYNPNRFI